MLLLILADIANIEQASLCIRYVLNDQIHEKFLMFIPSDDRSGFGLSNLIIKTVQDLGKNYFFQNEKIIELFPCFQDWTWTIALVKDMMVVVLCQVRILLFCYFD